MKTKLKVCSNCGKSISILKAVIYKNSCFCSEKCMRKWIKTAEKPKDLNTQGGNSEIL